MSILGFAAAVAVALGPQQELDQTPNRVDDVVVTARSPDEQMRSFMEDISLPEGSLHTARFFREVCVGAINLKGAAAQAIVDRISQVGMDLGLEAGEPGCRPNILVIATNDGNAMAKGLVENRRRFFDPGGSGMIRSRAALNRFQNSGKAIRWWHVAVPTDARTGQIAARLPGETAPVVTGSASRLRSELRHDIARVMVILDLSKLTHLNFNQVADYSAMVAYSQVDDAGDFSDYNSVLALADTEAQISGLTDWDREYLGALYSARLNQTARMHQQGEIMSLIRQGRARTTDEGVDATDADHTD